MAIAHKGFSWRDRLSIPVSQNVETARYSDASHVVPSRRKMPSATGINQILVWSPEDSDDIDNAICQIRRGNFILTRYRFPQARTYMTKWHGFYSTPQVARLARVPVSTLYNWKKRGIIAPSVELVNVNGQVIEAGYTYANLVIIKIMRALREDRMDLTSVGVALRHMYERLGPPSEGWSDANVYIVGNKIFAEKPDDWQTTSATGFGQRVDTRVFGDLFPLLRAQEEEGSILIPRDYTAYVEIDPSIMGGQPVVRNTRVPTSLFPTLLDKGKSIDDLIRLYSPIPRETIEKTVEFEKYLDSVA